MLRAVAALLDDIAVRQDPARWAEQHLRQTLRDAPFVRAVTAVSTTAGPGGAAVDVVRLDCHHRFVRNPHRPAIRARDRIVCHACRRAGDARPISNTLGDT